MAARHGFPQREQLIRSSRSSDLIGDEAGRAFRDLGPLRRRISDCPRRSSTLRRTERGRFSRHDGVGAAGGRSSVDRDPARNGLVRQTRVIWVTHMKTTIDIADPLLRRAKQLAARRNVTLTHVIEDALRQSLKADIGRRNPQRLRTPHVSRPGATARFVLGRLEQLAVVRLRGARRVIAVDTNLLLYAHRADSPLQPG